MVTRPKPEDICLAAITHVLVAAGELQKLPVKKLMQSEELAFLDGLPSSRGGMLPATKRSMDHLRYASDLALSASSYNGYVSGKAVYKQFKQEIARRFIAERQKLNRRSAHKAMQAALERSAEHIQETRVQYIACNIAFGSSPDAISIGPVTFMPSAVALDKADKSFGQYLASHRPSGPRRWDPLSHLAEIEQHFSSFGWAAEVVVKGFDTEMGDAQARRLAQAALDCLHLLVGGRWSSRMRLDGDLWDATRPATFGISAKGELSFTINYRSTSYSLGESWWQQVQSNAGPNGRDLLGLAIERAICPAPTPLSRRFMDSLAWYGDAIREKATASRIVKFVTAMETALATRTETDLAEGLSARGAALMWLVQGRDFKTLRQRLKSIYNVRSRIVHGDTVLTTRELDKALGRAEYLSREVLCSALQLFGREGLEAPKVSAKKIEKNFAKIVALASRGGSTHRPVNAFP